MSSCPSRVETMGHPQPRPTYSFVAGCPAQYSLLASNPYHDNNRLLFGQATVVTDAHNRGPTRASKLFSPLVPTLWYSMCQSYIPYNCDGLNGTHIIREALQKLVASASDLEGQGDEKQYQQRVWQLLVGMRGDQKWYSLRFGCWLLSYIFKWLFNGEIFVGSEVVAQLREMAPTSTFVFVPTHKSHLDYHMLSYVLFAQGLACPHIAAGDNLNLPVVGSIMRTCGAFFIRRSIKSSPDAALYKRTLDMYLSTLLSHGAPLEYFIEGGRARDGRIATPKLGLLTSTVDTALSDEAKGGLAIVPVSISYDFPLEEAGLLQELLGQRKKRESVFQFVSAFGKLVARVLWAVLSGGLRRPLGAGGTRGRVAIGFAHPIPIRKFLKDRVRRRKKRGTVTRSKPDLLHVSSSEVTFEELLELASQADAAAAGRGESGAKSTAAAPRSVRTPGDTLSDALPPGSSARRAAVAALGNEIHTRLLRNNVIPSSAVLAAALLPPELIGETWEAGSMEDQVSEPAPPRKSTSTTIGVPGTSLIRRYRWVQRQLTAHNMPFMPLPSSPISSSGCDCATSHQFLESIARSSIPHVICANPAKSSRHVDRRSSSGRGGTGGTGSQLPAFAAALASGPCPVLWQHTRLNMILPATGTTGLVACALSAVSGAGTQVCPEPAQAAAVINTVLWLRGLLAPDLNAALGAEALTSSLQVQSELARLVQVGELICHPPASPISSPGPLSPAATDGASPLASDLTSRAGLDILVGQSFNASTAAAGSRRDGGSSVGSVSNGADGNGVAGGALERAPVYSVPAGTGGISLRFHAATLVPLAATYAAVLKFACAHLGDGKVMGRAEFSTASLRWIRESCEQRLSAMGPIPSQLVVQHAVEALVDAGCLLAHNEEAGSAAMPHAASTINLESQSIAVPPSVASASPAASTSTVQAGGQASRVPSAQEPAAKGGIAQPKGGTLSLRGQAVQVAQHTLERLQQCFGALLPLQVELPRIET